jgi:multidrug resistance efflux pump
MERFMKRLLPTLPFWLFGVALLAITAYGATWGLRSRADERAPASHPGESPGEPGLEGIVCVGHVDVEAGVTPLYPSQPGRVADIQVHEDESVKAGQVILRVDDRLYRYQVQQAEQDVKAAELQLADAKKIPQQHRLKLAQQEQSIAATHSRLSAARHIADRKQKLLQNLQVPAEEAAAAADLVKELEAAEKAEQEKLQALRLMDPATQIARAESDLAAKQAKLEQAKYAAEECVLRAPADGKILRILVGAGEMLGPQPRQPAIQFCAAGPRIVRAEVEQEFASRVAVGEIAVVADDSHATTTWRGKVIRVSDWYTHRRSIIQEPLQVNDVRTLECIIQLEAGQSQPRIGQRVRVTLTPAKQ